jgi:hypothetical protein
LSVVCFGFAMVVIRMHSPRQPLEHKPSASEETGSENKECGDRELGGGHASDETGR